ncbi:MAG: hypothetical protein ACYS0K_22530 [Planctomycetota bacterium]|jgi:hypothetical protein
MTPEAMLRKYERLVWFARSDLNKTDVPDDIAEGRFKAYCDVEVDYPEEVEALGAEHGDWQHGFNSGVLAALRWMLEEDRELADEEFPELSS